MFTQVRSPLHSPFPQSSDDEDEEWPPAHILARTQMPSRGGDDEPEHDVPVAFVEHPSRHWLRLASATAGEHEDAHPLGRRMCFDVRCARVS